MIFGRRRSAGAGAGGPADTTKIAQTDLATAKPRAEKVPSRVFELCIRLYVRLNSLKSNGRCYCYDICGKAAFIICMALANERFVLYASVADD